MRDTARSYSRPVPAQQIEFVLQVREWGRGQGLVFHGR